ncbi:MAG: hypothetical protein ACREPR_24750 [Brasilonema sp.]
MDTADSKIMVIRIYPMEVETNDSSRLTDGFLNVVEVVFYETASVMALAFS